MKTDWKQLQLNCEMLQKKKLSHSTVPDTSSQSLTEFYVNSSAAVLCATEDTFSLSGNPLLFFVIPNTLLKMRGVCHCSKESCKKNPHLVQRWEMKWVLSIFFPCPSITQPLVNRHSDETGLSWSNSIKVFPYTLFHFNLHCTLLRRGCPICQ